MKKYISFICMITLLFCGLISCDREKIDYGLGGEKPEEGIGKFEFKFDLSVKEIGTKASGIDVKDFIITILDSDNKKVLESPYKEIPEIVDLEVGSYVIQAESPGYNFAMGDAPYYKGTESFRIKKDQVTIIDKIVCTLANIKVEMVVDASLTSILSEYDVTATFNPSTDNLSYSFDESETSAVKYFPSLNSGEDVLFVQFKGSNASGTITKNITYTEVKAGEYRKITFTYKEPGSNNGSAGIDLDVDANCEVVDDEGATITVPGIEDNGGDPNPEEPGDGGEVSITGFSFGGSRFEIEEPLIISDIIELIVLIEAEKGIENLFVTINSTSEDFTDALVELHLGGRFDLANPANPELEAVLGGMLELPIKEAVYGKTSLPFDISAFTGMLPLFPGTHQFTIYVVDPDDNEDTKTLTLIVEED